MKYERKTLRVWHENMQFLEGPSTFITRVNNNDEVILCHLNPIGLINCTFTIEELEDMLEFLKKENKEFKK